MKRAKEVLDRGDFELIARVGVPRTERLGSIPPVAAVRSAACCRRGRLHNRGLACAAPRHERAALLGLRNRKARLNRQNPTEDGNAIDWARWSYSPITGCKHNCPYCYIGDFVSIVPMFHPDRLSAPLNIQSPPVTGDIRDRCVFVGALADMFGRWVPSEWIQAIIDVFRACLDAGWIFIVCTKVPQRDCWSSSGRSNVLARDDGRSARPRCCR